MNLSQIIRLIIGACTIQIVLSSPLVDHDSNSKPVAPPLPAPSPLVSSVSIPKSAEVDSAIHTLKTGEPANAANIDGQEKDLDSASSFIFAVPYGGLGFGGGFGYPGYYGGYGGYGGYYRGYGGYGLGGYGYGR